MDETYSALQAAIQDRLDDDTPRLALADWLDDHAGTVPCRACEGRGHDDTPWPMSNGCDRCRGSGAVSDGRRERAEFVRVQVELARRSWKDQTCGLCGIRCEDSKAKYCPRGYGDPDGKNSHRWQDETRDELRRRERELWERPNRLRGSSLWPHPWFDLPGSAPNVMLHGPTGCWIHTTAAGELVEWGVRRGFVDEARLSLAALVGGPGRTDYPAPNVPGLAAALGRVVGLTRVTIVGAEPHESPFSPSWNWFDDDSGRVVYPDAIPGELFDLLPALSVPLSRSPRSHKSFPTRAAALDALAAAALAFCKQAAAHQPAAAPTAG